MLGHFHIFHLSFQIIMAFSPSILEFLQFGQNNELMWDIEEFQQDANSNCQTEDANLFEVETIVAHRVNHSSGKDEWLTSWVGYEQKTWEPAVNFLGNEAIRMLVEFEHQRKKKEIKIKLGEQCKLKNVPGKLIVKRQMAASKEPQYLFAGQTAWTSNGKDRIGIAELDFATGTMVIPNFSDNDFGSYTFPLEKSSLNAVNVPEGACVLQGVGETLLELIKKE